MRPFTRPPSIINRFFSFLPLRPITRRRIALAISVTIPIICFFIGLSDPSISDPKNSKHHPKYVKLYLWLSCWPPAILSFVLFCTVGRLRKTPLMYKKYLLITLSCQVFSCVVSFLTPGGSESTPFAFINSCLFMGWGWAVDSALGIENKLGFLSVCSSIAVSFSKAYSKDNGDAYQLLGLIPVAITIAFTVFDDLWGSKVFPEDDLPSRTAFDRFDWRRESDTESAWTMYLRTKKLYLQSRDFHKSVHKDNERIVTMMEEVKNAVANMEQTDAEKSEALTEFTAAATKLSDLYLKAKADAERKVNSMTETMIKLEEYCGESSSGADKSV